MNQYSQISQEGSSKPASPEVLLCGSPAMVPKSYTRRHTAHALLLAALLTLIALNCSILVLAVKTYRLAMPPLTAQAPVYSTGAFQNSFHAILRRPLS